MTDNLVEIEGMKRYYEMISGTVKALDGVDIEVMHGDKVDGMTTSDYNQIKDAVHSKLRN